MRVVLDTSVLIEGLADPVDAEFAISTISLAELHFGVLMAKTPELRVGRLRRLASIERAFEALPVTDAIARTYGGIAATVAAAGRQPRARSFDLVIAATAATHDAALYTRNPKDFAHLQDFVDVVAV
ncbi:PIN domain-containing protein [Kribbella sandramycini]|uniref:Ribonuclease VapC n=1 Tax=Kribbella sandramycini TaxID=60450 RepID=A0A7Y4L199_9ACTN|nr:PIN domain-containing protein [Kribbella sandramycini]MBB6564794.1 putative nucleic acid-binding protein [Kribbella sandramycini]NOL42493.1 PIN domain-containing protein [Kribbella sandramycini]